MRNYNFFSLKLINLPSAFFNLLSNSFDETTSHFQENFLLQSPFTLAENNEIPYENLIAIRLAIFATFGFYGLMHLLHGSKEVYPVHFLKTFLFMLSFMGLIVFIKTNAEVSVKQWLIILFFFCVAIILHFSTISKIRRFGR